MHDPSHLHAIRKHEIEAAFSGIDLREKRILEIGAGDGFLSSELAKFGETSAIDISAKPETLFPVQIYDGHHIPFDDRTFDVLFSSNVLEHIPHLYAFHTEMRRVLKPDGFGVHVVPSATWRLWTMLTHYPALPKIARSRAVSRPALTTARQSGKLSLLGKVLIASRHGERGNRVTEALHFRSAAWVREMERGGWTVSRVAPCGLFYSGYSLAGACLPLPARMLLSRFMGSSTIAILTS